MFLNLLLTLFLHSTKSEEIGLGDIDDTSSCNHITDVPAFQPIRTSINTVEFFGGESITSTSKNTVLAVGVGSEWAFRGHGERNPVEGVSFSWMNQDPSFSEEALTKMSKFRYGSGSSRQSS